jgi:hypothetical protein
VVRSNGRIPKVIPILLIGSDWGGRVFSEHTTTVVLSLHGAGLVSKHKLSPDQELILRLTDLNKETEIRVVGQIGSQHDSYTYGVAFLDPLLNFWGIDFPPTTAAERDLGLITLVCSSCKEVEEIDDNSVEADVCATNDGVLRFCKHCGSTTDWKHAVSAANGTGVLPEPTEIRFFPSSPSSDSATIIAPRPVLLPAPAGVRDSPAPSPAPATSLYDQSFRSEQGSDLSPSLLDLANPDIASEPQGSVLTMPLPELKPFPRDNRRKHPRVKVSYSACIRHPERGDDIVTCEDMSKGGLRFKSKKQYYAQALIDVAVPYVHGQAAIFVPGRIVFVEELPEQRHFRCGVQYLLPTKSRDQF